MSEVHKIYNLIIEKLNKAIDKNAIPYKGNAKMYDGVEYDRVLNVNSEVKVSEHGLEYTYLHRFLTRENNPNKDEDNNIIIGEGEGTYDVYYADIYLNKEYFDMYKYGEIKKNHFILNDNTWTPILIECSYIFYKEDELKSLLSTIVT